ncbi:hypothetical protein CcI49_12340 [Frankia sp. CcI49]|uniref:hypothetical protein n=1 Tax=Frankia sp. CcI49 TaxID=1745382 RepID=UPI0009776C57|nr:hypothetical protein [Frankia sp. CcI49]ONH60179.1 hypothetical protein CcI49_12340 [Frankia sp. CcI49]
MVRVSLAKGFGLVGTGGRGVGECRSTALDVGGAAAIAEAAGGCWAGVAPPPCPAGPLEADLGCGAGAVRVPSAERAVDDLVPPGAVPALAPVTPPTGALAVDPARPGPGVGVGRRPGSRPDGVGGDSRALSLLDEARTSAELPASSCPGPVPQAASGRPTVSRAVNTAALGRRLPRRVGLIRTERSPDESSASH